MVISPEDAFSILNKWKEDSAHIGVVAESPFRHNLRDMQDRSVRWTMSQRVTVLRVDTKQRIVEFEGPAGNMSLSVHECRFVYGDPREAAPELRGEAEAETVSALCIFSSRGEGFLLYELREPYHPTFPER